MIGMVLSGRERWPDRSTGGVAAQGHRPGITPNCTASPAKANRGDRAIFAAQ
jgi:hypothetical protein